MENCGTIVLVDDDVQLLGLTAEILEDAGFTVRAFSKTADRNARPPLRLLCLTSAG